MDLFVWVKGIKPHVNKWENDLMAQWCSLYQNGKKKTTGAQAIQLGVEPINLYTIRFPKEELDRVLGMVGGSEYLLKKHKPLRKLTRYVKKFMGLKDVPKPSKIMHCMQPHPVFKSVAVTPIGLKEEEMREDGTENL